MKDDVQASVFGFDGHVDVLRDVFGSQREQFGYVLPKLNEQFFVAWVSVWVKLEGSLPPSDTRLVL